MKPCTPVTLHSALQCLSVFYDFAHSPLIFASCIQNAGELNRNLSGDVTLSVCACAFPQHWNFPFQYQHDFPTVEEWADDEWSKMIFQGSQGKQKSPQHHAWDSFTHFILDITVAICNVWQHITYRIIHWIFLSLPSVIFLSLFFFFFGPVTFQWLVLSLNVKHWNTCTSFTWIQLSKTTVQKKKTWRVELESFLLTQLFFS